MSFAHWGGAKRSVGRLLIKSHPSVPFPWLKPVGMNGNCILPPPPLDIDPSHPKRIPSSVATVTHQRNGTLCAVSRACNYSDDENPKVGARRPFPRVTGDQRIRGILQTFGPKPRHSTRIRCQCTTEAVLITLFFPVI